ncbi:MAG: histidinol dehydrogenase [Gammaproteobacteria bacterium]|nr:histidinol dehydrogenase [Gammaproteobacteria bacterium]
MAINRLYAAEADFELRLASLLGRAGSTNKDITASVRDIIEDVRQRGDQALFEYTAKFDQCDINRESVEINAAQLHKATQAIAPELLNSLNFAADRIRAYHQQQLQGDWHITEPDGTRLGQKVTPIKRVGLYVPGGKAAYPSSVLMNAIPAKVAGVEELIVVSPAPQGAINQAVLAAAAVAGVDRFFQIGGAQAVAALTFGTESIPAVDKITGPGNQYVAEAKKQVYGRVGIDMIAGPSEVLVIADDSADPEWIAMDMFAQAEHDEMAQAILLTSDPALADAVANTIERLLDGMPRREIITESLRSHGAIIVVENPAQLVTVADTIAAEHLEIFTRDADQLAATISNAGAIFVGPYSAESLGDYCAGPNHVLPTSGTARFSSPLGVYDFQKRTSVLNISMQGAQSMAEHAARLADSEELPAHAASARLRQGD